jgi:hypothetical protein
VQKKKENARSALGFVFSVHEPKQVSSDNLWIRWILTLCHINVGYDILQTYVKNKPTKPNRVFREVGLCWVSLSSPIWCLIFSWLVFAKSYNKEPKIENPTWTPFQQHLFQPMGCPLGSSFFSRMRLIWKLSFWLIYNGCKRVVYFLTLSKIRSNWKLQETTKCEPYRHNHVR